MRTALEIVAFYYLDESIEGVSCEVVSFWLELGHRIAHLNNSDLWTLLLGQAEEFKDSTIIINISINQYE